LKKVSPALIAHTRARAPGNSLGGLSTAHDIAIAQNGDILTAHLDGRAQLFSLE